MIRVAITEDHPEMRTALRLLLKLSADTIELVSMLKDGQEALDYVKNHQPDVIIMDIRMPVLDGLTATKRIRDLPVRTRILLISSTRGEYVLQQAMRAGAQGFLPKDELGKSLIQAIEAIYRGEEFFVK